MQLDHLNHKMVLNEVYVYNLCLSPTAKLLSSIDSGWTTRKGVKKISRRDVNPESGMNIQSFEVTNQ